MESTTNATAPETGMYKQRIVMGEGMEGTPDDAIEVGSPNIP